MTEQTEESYKWPYNAIFSVMKFHADQYYDDPIPPRLAKDFSEASEMNGQLFTAADVGDVKLLQQMLEQGADVNFQHCAGTPLNRAARRGHLSCVQALLDHGANVNLSGHFNCQTCKPLHAAASNGHYEIAKLLIDRGADVHAKREQDSTPLHDAAKFGHPDIAELLLQHGAQVNAKNARGKTPIYYAASEGMLDGLRWILEAVVEYYHYRGYYYNKSFYPRDAVEYLLDKQKKVKTLNMTDLQDLRTSLLKNDLDTIKDIVENRPEGNLKTRHLKLLNILLEAGGNLEILHEYESGPLEEAILNKDADCISLFIKYGAVVNRPGVMYGWKATPLHFACDRGTENIVKILLENGADPNAQDNCGKTPLHEAVSEGRAQFVQLLLQHGARVHITSTDGETPLHVVKTLDCAKLLVDHGADVTAVTKNGRSVLFSPSDRCGEGECVKFLIAQGADPFKEDKNGTTALDLAINRWHSNCSYEKDDGGVLSVKVLMQNGAKLKDTNKDINKSIRCRKLGLAFALLRSGHDINALGVDRATPLFFAAQINFADAVKMLLKEGADPNIKCRNMSPLQIALIKEHEEVAKLLLQAGAIPIPDIYNFIKAVKTYINILKDLNNLQWQDSEGNTPMHIECYRSASIHYLLEVEANANVTDKYGITPLHIVCYKGSIYHVKLLLKNKADCNKKDENGLTPLHFAAFR
ncbi:hypothetical protein L9F63_016639, partial [Diploptera punctata]